MQLLLSRCSTILLSLLMWEAFPNFYILPCVAVYFGFIPYVAKLEGSAQWLTHRYAIFTHLLVCIPKYYLFIVMEDPDVTIKGHENQNEEIKKELDNEN